MTNVPTQDRTQELHDEISNDLLVEASDQNEIVSPAKWTLTWHENENYRVHTNHEYTAYEVVNRKTGVTELLCETMMEAIDFAEHSNSFLVNQLWRWIAQKGKQMHRETNVEALTYEEEDLPPTG